MAAGAQTVGVIPAKIQRTRPLLSIALRMTGRPLRIASRPTLVLGLLLELEIPSMYCTIPRTLSMPSTVLLWHCGWSPSFYFSWPLAFAVSPSSPERLVIVLMAITWAAADTTGMDMAIINITTTIPVAAEVGMAAMAAAAEMEIVRLVVVTAGEGIVVVVEGIVEEENE